MFRNYPLRALIISTICILGGAITGVGIGWLNTTPLAINNPLVEQSDEHSLASQRQSYATAGSLQAMCDQFGEDISAEASSTISSSVTGLNATTEVVVTVNDPGPALLKTHYGRNGPPLNYCLSPLLPSPHSTELRGGKFFAKFTIDPQLLDARYQTTDQMRPPVFIDIDWWSEGFVGIALCPDKELGFVPKLCGEEGDNTIKIDVNGLRSGICRCGPYGPPPFADEGPNLERSPPPFYFASTPEPSTATFGLDSGSVAWRFNTNTSLSGGRMNPVGVWIEVPAATRAALAFGKVENADGRIGTFRVDMSYVAYAFAPLIAVLIAITIAFRIKRPARLGIPYNDYRGLRLVRRAKLILLVLLGVLTTILVAGGLLLVGSIRPSSNLSWTTFSGIAVLSLGLLTLYYATNGSHWRWTTKTASWSALAFCAITGIILLSRFSDEFAPAEVYAFDTAQGIQSNAFRDGIWVFSAAYVAVMTAVVACVGLHSIGKLGCLISSDTNRRQRISRWLVRTVGGVLCLLVGYLYASSPIWLNYNRGAGSYNEAVEREFTLIKLASVTLTELPYLVSLFTVPLLLPIAAMALVSVWTNRFDKSVELGAWRKRDESVKAIWFPSATVVALVLAMAAPWSERGSVAIVVTLPAWLLQFVLLRMLLIRIVGRPFDSPATSHANERAILLGRLRQDAPGRNPDGGYDHSEASRLLALGPADHPMERAMMLARGAAVMSVVGVGITAFTAVEASLQGSWGFGFVLSFTLVAALIEFIRWIVTGFIFGYLYPHLPTRTGPVKALILTGIWAIGAWSTAAVVGLAGVSVVQPTIYRTAQFAVLAVALGLYYDFMTMRNSGGTWRDLRKVYARHNYLEIAAVATPVLLAIITLINQIASGAGMEAAETVISGVRSVIGSSS